MENTTPKYNNHPETSGCIQEEEHKRNNGIPARQPLRRRQYKKPVPKTIMKDSWGTNKNSR